MSEDRMTKEEFLANRIATDVQDRPAPWAARARKICPLQNGATMLAYPTNES